MKRALRLLSLASLLLCLTVVALWVTSYSEFFSAQRGASLLYARPGSLFWRIRSTDGRLSFDFAHLPDNAAVDSGLSRNEHPSYGSLQPQGFIPPPHNLFLIQSDQTDHSVPVHMTVKEILAEIEVRRRGIVPGPVVGVFAFTGPRPATTAIFLSRPIHWRIIHIPHWLPALILLFLASPCLSRLSGPIRARIRKRLTKPGHCPICNYDLRATPHRCPECGHAISPDQTPAA